MPQDSYKIVDAPLLTLREYVRGVLNCTSRNTTLRSNAKRNRLFLAELRHHLDTVVEEVRKMHREQGNSTNLAHIHRTKRLERAEGRMNTKRYTVLKKIRLGTATDIDEAVHLKFELRYEKMVGLEIRRTGADKQAMELLETCKKMLRTTIKTIADEHENVRS